MDYMDMRRDELVALCRERGVAFPAKAPKAQLSQLLEAQDLADPIEVAAVPVEDGIIPANALAVDVEAMQAAAISLTGAMDSAAACLGDYAVDDETLGGLEVADIRICEEGIAAALRDVDARRKELTRLLTEPKKAIDANVRELTGPLSELAGRYADARQAIYERGYRAQYEDCCIANGLERLPELVPYERFVAGHGQWVSRTANPVKVQERIADEVARIAHDWETLRGRRGFMRFYDEAEREFFATLSLEAAMRRDEEASAQQDKLEAARREREENERWRAEHAAEQPQEPPAPAWRPEFVEVGGESAAEPERPTAPARTPQARRRYRFEAWLDDAELASFREWKNACGVGEGWTFREIREVA